MKDLNMEEGQPSTTRSDERLEDLASRGAVRVNFYLSRDEHRQLKFYSVETGRPMADIFRDAVRSIIKDVNQCKSSSDKNMQQVSSQFGDVDNAEVPMKMPPSTAFGKILFIITPLLLSAIAGLVGALLCFLYRTADYHLDMWQHFSMLKLIFQNDEYILDRYYILFATLWGIMIVGIPLSYAYQNTLNMWIRKGMWK